MLNYEVRLPRVLRDEIARHAAENNWSFSEELRCALCSFYGVSVGWEVVGSYRKVFKKGMK